MITANKVKAMDARAAAVSGFCGVLFLDIVSFSRMTETGQAKALCALDRIISSSESVAEARHHGKVQIHPRGDGKLLIFSGGLFPALHAAAQIASAAARQRPFELRMGVHYGPVRASDPRMPNSEVVGDGVNTAQRIMDCGDAGHILLSHSAAKWAAQNEGWSPLVRFSGNCAVKHGVVLSVYTLHGAYKNHGFIGKDVKPSRIRYYQQDTQSWEREANPSRYLRPILAVFCVGVLAVLGFSSMRTAPKKVVRPANQKAGSARSTVHPKKQFHIRQQIKYRPSAEDLPAKEPSQPRFIALPNLIDETEESAREKLVALGLKISVVKSEPDADTVWDRKGVVYKQFPEDEMVQSNTVVTIYLLNDSPEPETAPNDTSLPSSTPESVPESVPESPNGDKLPKESIAPPSASYIIVPIGLKILTSHSRT